MKRAAAFLFLLACGRTPAASTAAPEPPVVVVASASAAASAAPVEAGAPLDEPSSHPVMPRVEFVYQQPTIIEDVRADGLPAISKDGKFVVALAHDDSPAQCASSQLMAFERPSKTPGRAKLAWAIRFTTVGCVEDTKPSAELNALRSAQSAANAKLRALDLRSFDGEHACDLTITTDADGMADHAKAKSKSGALFDIDLAPISSLTDPAFHDTSIRGRLVQASTFDVDVSAKVLLVRGTYMSVNSWFPADRTTHVFVW